ncbi:MAG: sulfatase [Planctomycetota bacterium]|nr:MAG: sulfatase [Planctomycetota bacterium]
MEQGSECRRRWGLILASLVLAAAWSIVSVAASPDRPPHIVLLVADDLGINDLGCYGRADHVTPALDRFAATGTRYTAATAAASVCSPSRVALLTGVHPARVNLTTFLPGRPDRASHKLLSPVIAQALPAAIPTLAERLAPAGYRSHFVGKWHLGGHGALPTDRGFTTAAGGRANPGPESTEGAKGEQRQAADAVRIIAEQIRDHHDEPFLLVVGFDSPHVPLAAPAAALPAHAGAFNPTYATMVSKLDDAVGKILTALDEAGIADSTLVAFTSDNGGLHVPEIGDPPPTLNAPFRAGKGFLYDGGVRVPLIVRFPGGTDAGRMMTGPVSTGDLVPTICRLAGVAAPQPADFHDLADAAPPSASDDRPFFWHQPHYTNQGGRPAGAIRLGDWKLVEHFEDGRLELFHTGDDVGEATDRSAAEPGRVADLRGRLEAWRRSVSAQEMTANPRFDPAAWQASQAEIDVSRLPAAATAAEMVAPLAAWRKAMDDDDAGPPATRNGFIRLLARDATVSGEKLCYEPQPEKDTLGYWVNAADRAWWDFRLNEPGRYRVTVLQGCGAGQGGSTVELNTGVAGLEFTVEETGHFQRFVPRDVGTLDLPAGNVRLVVTPLEKKAAAVMDLRSVTLERVD